MRLCIQILLRAVPTVAGVVILGFLLLELAPGDAADVLAGEAGAATEETLAALRTRFGLDLPALHRLIAYLSHLTHFDLGYSPRYNMPVADLIAIRLPRTLALMGMALFLAFAIGITLGALMASFAGRWPDRLLSAAALLLYSVPGFWLGLVLIIIFSVHLGWLPSGGTGTIGANLDGVAAATDALRHLMLPAVSLAAFFMAVYARLVRAAMLEAATQDFVRTAWAKGLSPFQVTLRHILRNALLPVTTMAGLHLGGMMGGAVVVETVYTWPGLGRLAFEAVMSRDFQVLLAVFLLSSLFVIAANVAVDILHAWLDPRIEVH